MGNEADNLQEQLAVKQEVKQDTKQQKRDNGSNSSPRPLKTSKGNNGQTIYHLDSDDEVGDANLA